MNKAKTVSKADMWKEMDKQLAELKAAIEWKNFGGGTMMRNGIHILSTMMYLKQVEAETRGEKITVKSVTGEMGQISKVPFFRWE